MATGDPGVECAGYTGDGERFDLISDDMADE